MSWKEDLERYQRDLEKLEKARITVKSLIIGDVEISIVAMMQTMNEMATLIGDMEEKIFELHQEIRCQS